MDPITLSALEAFPRQLDATYAAIPADFKAWAPPSWDGVPSEPLTAIEQVCHVRDIEVDGYHVRLRRTLEELHPTLASLDTDALVIERSYRSANVDEVLAAFRVAREETVRLIGSFTTQQLRRTAYFEGYGPVTLLSLVHFLCSHDQQHVAGLQWLMGKIHALGVRV